MSNIWFTADTHFGHFNIAKYCGRPFLDAETKAKLADLELQLPNDRTSKTKNEIYGIKNRVTREMDATLIANWNSRIAKDDQVYFLGDFCFADTDQTKRYIDSLNGNIAFIEGNHDKSVQQFRHLFKPFTKYMKITIDGIPVILFHYALRVWDRSHHGAYSLYGHSHGSLPDDPNSLSFDCGVDTNNFFPYSWDDVKRKMASKTWKAVDHHGS